MIRILVVTLVACSLIIVLAGALFCQATLHVPRRVAPAPTGAVTVTIEGADHARLSAWWMQPASPTGSCVLVLHGIGDSRLGSSGFAPMFLTQGYSALFPDSRAHGVSEGRFVTYGLLEKYDALAWAKWLRNAGCRKVYALGESLGAAVLIQAAAVEPKTFDAIAAECAFADLRQIAAYRIADVPAAKLLVADGMLYACLVCGLDIHGLKDDGAPPSNWLVPKAPHGRFIHRTRRVPPPRPQLVRPTLKLSKRSLRRSGRAYRACCRARSPWPPAHEKTTERTYRPVA